MKPTNTLLFLTALLAVSITCASAHAGSLGGRACFYTDKDYGGDRACFDADNEVLRLGLAMAFSSVEFQSDPDDPAMDRFDGLRGIELYRGRHYSGPPVTIYRNTSDLSTVGIDNAVVSFRLKTNDKVCFYKDVGYRGRETCIDAQVGGNYQPHLGPLNDTWSSMRVFGRAYTAVWTDSSAGGDHTFISQNVYSFGSRNDQISSVSVLTRQSDAHACFYEHYNFLGTPRCIVAHPDPADVNGNHWYNFDNGIVDNDRVSSVKIAGNARIEIWDYINFSGTQITLTHSQSNLGHAGVNDWINSALVTEISRAEIEPTKRKIDIQEAVYSELPFNQAHIMATHNSFNSSAYLHPIYGKNQHDTVYEQMEQGARMIDLDTDSPRDGEVVFCHRSSLDCIFGGGVDTARIAGEIEDFVRQMDDNDFLFVSLQDDDNHTINASNSLLHKFLGTLQPYIYKPTDHGQQACMDTFDESVNKMAKVPSIREMREAGKRIVVLVEKNCSAYTEPFKSFLYNANHSDHASYRGQPARNNFSVFEPWHNNHWVGRVYEDFVNPNVGDVNHGDMLHLHRTGVQIYMPDFVIWPDNATGPIPDHFVNQLWAGANSTMLNPNNTVATLLTRGTSLDHTGVDGAIHFVGVHDANMRGVMNYRALCRNDAGDWTVTAELTNIYNAARDCPDGYKFDLPLTPSEFQELIEDSDYQAVPAYTKIIVNLMRTLYVYDNYHYSPLPAWHNRGDWMPGYAAQLPPHHLGGGLSSR